MASSVILMIAVGFVSPHISLETLSSTGLIGVSLLTLGFFTARSLSSLIHSPLMIRLNPRVMGLISLYLVALTYLLYVVLPPTTYPLVKVLEGFMAGLFWPLMQSILVGSVSPNWRSRWLSVYFLLGAASGYIGVQLGSVLIILFGEASLIPAGFIIVILYGVFYALIAPNRVFNDNSAGRRPGFFEALSEAGRLVWLIPLLLLLGGVNGLLKDYLFGYARIATGFDEALLRLYWSIAGYTGLLLSILMSYIYEARRRMSMVLVLGTICSSTIIILPLASVNPLLYFMVIALTIVGLRILRPIVRGYASSKASRPEHGIAFVNSLSNLSAGLIPFIVALAQVNLA